MNHEDYKQMLALEALEALDGAEKQALEAHLSTCAECAAELRELRDSTAVLAYAAPPVAPPEGLRTRILEIIKTLPQTQEVSKPSRNGDQQDSTGTAQTQAQVIPFAERPRRAAFCGESLMGRLAAIAAALVIVALAALLFALWQRNTEMQQQLAGLSDRLNQTQRELNAAQNKLHEAQNEIARAREIEELLTVPGARVTLIELAGTERAPAASAALAYDQTTGRAVLLAKSLPAPPAGEVYKLWFIANNRPIPGEAFAPDQTGEVKLRDFIPPQGRNAPAFAVTVEPNPEVLTPSGKFVLTQRTS